MFWFLFWLVQGVQGKTCPKFHREIKSPRKNLSQIECEKCPDSSNNGCCPGYISLEGNCHECTAGKYTRNNSCHDCDPGFRSSSAAMVCLPCHITDITTDNIRCTTCKSGQHRISGSGSGVQCSPCGVGKSGASGVCTSCPTGQFQAETGQQICQHCLAGQYQNKQGQTKCQTCGANQVSNIGATSCAATCPPPSYLTDGTCVLCPDGERYNGNSCEYCEPGKFGTRELMFNTHNCTRCPRGHYQSEYGATACQTCPGGKVALQTGKACTYCPTGYVVSRNYCVSCKSGQFSKDGVCTRCPVGWQAPVRRQAVSEGRGACQKCHNGTYTSFTGTSTCYKCPTGYFQTQLGQTACSECPGGKFQTQRGQTACSECPDGKFQAQSGQHACSDCPKGFVTTDQQTCHVCPQGQYHNQSTHTCQNCSSGLLPNYYGTGSYECCSDKQGCQSCNSTSIHKGTQCELCPTGTYPSPTGTYPIRSLCQGCDNGKYAGKDGCVECAVGRFGNTTGTVVTNCQGCLPGLYQDQRGQASCLDCPQGQYQDNSAQTNCTHCGRGHSTTAVASEALIDCTECKTGQYKQKGVCAICEGFVQQQECQDCPGGWLANTPVGQSCLACEAGKAGTDGKSCQACSSGYYQYQDESGKEVCKRCFGFPTSSTSCPDCIAGTYQDRGSCLGCPSGWISKSRQMSCRQCSWGQYQVETSAATCIQCSEGQYQSGLGKLRCNHCSTGKFQQYPGRDVCEDCRRGLYQNEQGTATCKKCPDGYQSTKAGTSLLKDCESCPQGKSSGKTNQCESCAEGRYQDEHGMKDCKHCPTGWLSSEQSKSKEDCFDISSMESYVFGLKEDSKKPQSLTRDCEIRPNLVLLCSSCQCNRLSSLGFWGGPVCDVCARGYATGTCGVKCPGYDGLNDETICNNLGSCWFGKEGNGNCYCGGQSTIDRTAANTVVDVRLCAKGEKCPDYGSDRLTQTQYKPIYYILEYRQYSVFVLKLNNFTPDRGHMWFQRYSNHNWRSNDCTTCVGASTGSPHTYVGAYDSTGTYFRLDPKAQTKNGFHGENCQYECGLCLNGGQCNGVPHPWKFKYTIYNTFESQTEISVPQTTCQCATKQFDESAMCCPNGFQPYISYGKRGSPSYARYSHRPYLTTIQTHQTHPFWVNQDLWISDHGPPDYYIPSNNKTTVSAGEDTREVDYLHNGPYGKHVFYGQVQELCRACPGLFGKGVRQKAQLIQTHQDATKILFDDGSYDTCNSIGVCDFYRKELEQQVRFMGNARNYSRLKLGYSCSETPTKLATNATGIADCLTKQNTSFVTMYEDYVGIVDDKDLTTDGENKIVVKLTKFDGANLKRTHYFKKQGSQNCRAGTRIPLLVNGAVDAGAVDAYCANHCTTQNITTTGFSIESNNCYCTDGCTLIKDTSATHYTRTSDPVDNVKVTLYYRLKGSLPKPDNSGQYTVMQSTKNNCKGYDQCNMDLLQVVYGTSIYKKTKGFGDNRLTSSTFDRFDTCFTYTESPLVISSYITAPYSQGDDPFLGGACPKGYFCTMYKDIGYKEACPAGYYQSEIGQTRKKHAVQCSELSSESSESSDNCQKNTATTTVYTLVDKICIRCERNWYAPEGSAQCTQCPNGKVKKIAGIKSDKVQPVWNTPALENGNLQWYVTLDEKGTEDQDCAQMPAGIIHVPQKNKDMSYGEPEFLPIVTCPYGYSSFRGTFVYPSDSPDFVENLKTNGQSFVAPYIDSTNSKQLDWLKIVTARCHVCPGNSVSGGDSTTCMTCAANQMKTYMKQAIVKIVTSTVLQPGFNCLSNKTIPALAQIRNQTMCEAQGGEWKSGLNANNYQSVSSHRLSNYKLKTAKTEKTCSGCFEVKFASLVDRNELEVSDCILMCSRFFNNVTGFIITKDSCLCKVSEQTTVTTVYDNVPSTVANGVTCGNMNETKDITDKYTCQTQQYKLHTEHSNITSCKAGNKNKCSQTYSRYMELTACTEDNTIWWCCELTQWEDCKRPITTDKKKCSCYGLKNKSHSPGLQIGCLCRNDKELITSDLQTINVTDTDFPTYLVSNDDNTADWSGQALCSACQAGQHMTENSISCKNCPVGRYQESSSDAISNMACKVCTPGQYQDEDGKTTCKQCTPGQYQNEQGTKACKGCTPGRYQDKTGKSKCTACPAGFYQKFAGQSNCVECTPGFYQSQNGQTDCVFCPNVFNQGVNNQGVDQNGTTCQPCSSGKHAVDHMCESCPEGQGGSAGFCRCPLGWYSPDVNNKGACTICNAGQYQDETGHGCKSCVAGQYQDEAGQPSCLDCSSGKYAPYAPLGQIKCQDCEQPGLGGWLETITANNVAGKPIERGYFQQGPLSCTANNSMPVISQFRGTDCIGCSYEYTTFVRNENSEQTECYVLGACHATGNVTVESRDSDEEWPSTPLITYGAVDTNTRNQSDQSTSCDWSLDKNDEKEDNEWDKTCPKHASPIHFTMKKEHSTQLRITFVPYTFPQNGQNGQSLNLWLNCFSNTATKTPVTFWTNDPQNLNSACRSEQLNRPLTGLHSTKI